jgi:hypothetical protein
MAIQDIEVGGSGMKPVIYPTYLDKIGTLKIAYTVNVAENREIPKKL